MAHGRVPRIRSLSPCQCEMLAMCLLCIVCHAGCSQLRISDLLADQSATLVGFSGWPKSVCSELRQPLRALAGAYYSARYLLSPCSAICL